MKRHYYIGKIFIAVIIITLTLKSGSFFHESNAYKLFWPKISKSYLKY